MAGVFAESPQVEILNDSGSANSITFFDSTYAEALALAQEVRDYIAGQDKTATADRTPEERLLASCESMRITSRLTQVIAWLLVQKAIHAGELARSAANKAENRLGGQSVCDEVEPALEADLQPRMIDLLERSHSLYRRVARLDAMLDRQPGHPRPVEI